MISEYIEKKLKTDLKRAFLSAILCGIGVGFVTTFSNVLSLISTNIVVSKLAYGAAFSVLLLLIVLNGYELFTGNTMMLTTLHKKETRKKVLLNLLLVYSGNFIGCVAAAYIINLAGVHKTFDLAPARLAPALLYSFNAKTGYGIPKLLLYGVLANFFVCMGVYLSFKAKSVTEIYLSLFFPICIFCVLGFEHSIANMFTLSYAAFINKIPFAKAVPLILYNLAFATLGNIIGGVLFAFSTKVKKQI